MLVALQPVTVAAVPLKLTVLDPCVAAKLVPVIVTAAPIAPVVIDRLVMPAPCARRRAPRYNSRPRFNGVFKAFRTAGTKPPGGNTHPPRRYHGATALCRFNGSARAVASRQNQPTHFATNHTNSGAFRQETL